MSPFAQAAHDYAAEGFAVFPLRVRDKPPLPHTTGKDAASAEVELVVGWWSGRVALPPKADWRGTPIFARPNSNVAIATGVISGFWVFDIDGEGGEAALAALEAQHGALPVTPEQITGKGRQLLFAWDPAKPVRNMSKRSRASIGMEIDVRGDGGYIVAPPSIHPSGRTYTWREGRSPHELAFAAAPDWLMDLVSPIEASPAPVQPAKPRAKIEGSATPYGEKALDGVCADLRRTRKGSMNDAIWLAGIRIGQLCGGGEIASDSYALNAVRSAARDMVAASGCKWTDAREEDTLQRAFETGQRDPRSATPRQGPAPAAGRGAAEPKSAGDQAAEISVAASLWLAGRSAWCTAATRWLEARGLEPSATEALSLWRAHSQAPWGGRSEGPALLAPLVRTLEDQQRVSGGMSPDALAVLPLHPDCETFAHAVGEHAGRVVALGSLEGDAPLVVAMGVGDGWALAQRGKAMRQPVRVVIAPALSIFAGGALGDRYGRVNPAMPARDPAAPAWTLQGQGTIYLAVRRDLRPPPLKARKAAGGGMDVQLEGEAAARFYGALADQNWRAAGANAVRLLAPEPGCNGFNQGRDG